MLEESQANDEYKRYEGFKLDALLGWCEVTGCRRRPLLAYFGDSQDEDCGNCDGCLTPASTWDGTEAAQKLLSAVYRSDQRFGAAHLVDVLQGKETDKVLQHGHDQLSVFGIGKDMPSTTWRSVARQLIVAGHLRADAARFGALVLTETSRGVLRGETPLEFRVIRNDRSWHREKQAQSKLLLKKILICGKRYDRAGRRSRASTMCLRMSFSMTRRCTRCWRIDHRRPLRCWVSVVSGKPSWIAMATDSSLFFVMGPLPRKSLQRFGLRAAQRAKTTEPPELIRPGATPQSHPKVSENGG